MNNYHLKVDRVVLKLIKRLNEEKDSDGIVDNLNMEIAKWNLDC